MAETQAFLFECVHLAPNKDYFSIKQCDAALDKKRLFTNSVHLPVYDRLPGTKEVAIRHAHWPLALRFSSAADKHAHQTEGFRRIVLPLQAKIAEVYGSQWLLVLVDGRVKFEPDNRAIMDIVSDERCPAFLLIRPSAAPGQARHTLKRAADRDLDDDLFASSSSSRARKN